MNAEVIIVGGGIIGCAAAYNLAKNGVSVLVLEGSENIGNGGSTRNGGGVRQSGRDPRELPLVMYSIQHIWPQLSDMLDTNVEYYQEGNLRLGSTPQHQKIDLRAGDQEKRQEVCQRQKELYAAHDGCAAGHGCPEPA